MEPNQERVSLNLRVGPTIKSRVEDYARKMGLSTNAAAAVLLDRGLRAEAKDRDADA